MIKKLNGSKKENLVVDPPKNNKILIWVFYWLMIIFLLVLRWVIPILAIFINYRYIAGSEFVTIFLLIFGLIEFTNPSVEVVFSEDRKYMSLNAHLPSMGLFNLLKRDSKSSDVSGKA